MRRPLERELRKFLDAQTSSWDDDGAPGSGLPGGGHLWGNMPKVDSKAIARSSPIFKKYLGIKLKMSCIKPGGYRTIDEAIQHLVPEMIKQAKKSEGGK